NKKRLKVTSVSPYINNMYSVNDWIVLLYSLVTRLRVLSAKHLLNVLEEPHFSLLWQFAMGSIPHQQSVADHYLSDIGMQHIGSVSGMHFSIVHSAIASRIEGIGGNRSRIIIGVILFLYCLLTGWTVSALRSGCMTAMFLIAQQFKRQYRA